MKNKIITYVKNNRNKTAGILFATSLILMAFVIIMYNIGPLEGWNKGGNVLIDFFLLSIITVPLISSSILYQKGT